MVKVELVRTDGRMGPVGGPVAVSWSTTREQARKRYRERLQALRAAGWLKVEADCPEPTDRRRSG